MVSIFLASFIDFNNITENFNFMKKSPDEPIITNNDVQQQYGNGKLLLLLFFCKYF